MKVKNREKINPKTKKLPMIINIMAQRGIDESYFLSNSSMMALSFAQFSETLSSPA